MLLNFSSKAQPQFPVPGANDHAVVNHPIRRRFPRPSDIIASEQGADSAPRPRVSLDFSSFTVLWHTASPANFRRPTPHQPHSKDFHLSLVMRGEGEDAHVCS